MKCINCGEDIKKETKYCPKCGQRTNTTKEEILLKAYIGDGYEKIREESFSIPAFLFGPLYMLYRKLYAYGILLAFSIIVVVNSELVIDMGIIITWMFFYLLNGVFFNRIYMKEVKRRINNIKNKYPKLKEEELSMICKDKGGTSIIVPIIYVLSIILGIGLLLLTDNYDYIEPVNTLYYLSGGEIYYDDYYEDNNDYNDDYNEIDDTDNDYDNDDDYEYKDEDGDESTGCIDSNTEEETDCSEEVEVEDELESEEPINKSDGSDSIEIQENGE